MTLNSVKTFLIVFLAVLLGIVIYVHYSCIREPIAYPELDTIETQQLQLQSQQQQLLKEIVKHQNKEKELITTIDSLILVKQNIKVEYVENSKAVDILSPNLLVKEFDSLFSKFGVE